MASSQVFASIRPGTLIGGRYLVEHPLGKGGMGTVYAVRDESSQARLALKYLQREAALDNGPAAALFQREYHTLAHLRHPSVVHVYDYGVDGGRPFYTMELLDGSDLREVAPLPWTRACSVLRDVASSLALLHSRRLLHRDLSPRNVRCTHDGRAKLLDFGAMAPMGVAKNVAGTAPYMAPEAMNGQALDARTDLFALGALAYWTLTGHDAYPARDARELRELWPRPVVPPSTVLADVPEALDQLVMALLSLDPQARPSHVAEVIERLTSIAALPPADALDVAHAYLTSPTLIGHSDTLWGFHKRLVRAARGRGSSVLIAGRAGSGRTRLLQALALEAKLSGVLVLGATAESAARGELGVARTLFEDLLASAPDLALACMGPFADVLAPLVPKVSKRFVTRNPAAASDDAEERRARVLPALRDFLVAVSQQRPVMIAVDDLDHADEWSAAFVTMLASDARVERFVIAASAEDSGASQALAVFALAASRLELAPLSADESQSLLRSVFGDVAQLQVVAEWIQALAQGNPRAVMELAQYLVDHGVARYERGCFVLPNTLREQALPDSIEQALALTIAGLSAPARQLAEALALVVEQAQLELPELTALIPSEQPAQLYAALEELVAAQLVIISEQACALRQRELARVLHAGCTPERRAELHLRLAGVYDRRLDHAEAQLGLRLLAAWHRYRGGELDACVATLLALPVQGEGGYGRPRDLVEMYVASLRHAEAAGLSRAEVYPLRRALLGLSASDRGTIEHASETLAQLSHDSGRVYFDEYAGELDPLRRARECVKRARAAYESTTPASRGLEPVQAIYEFGACISSLTGSYVATNDTCALERLPALIEPFAPLSPVLELIGDLARDSLDGLRQLDVAARRRKALARLELPLDGLDPRVQHRTRCVTNYWLGMDEAVVNDAAALERATVLERQAQFAALGAQIRCVYHLFRGNEEQAELWQKRRELLLLRSPTPDATSMHGMIYEALGYYLCASVLGMRRALAPIAGLVEHYPGWRAIQRTIEGMYASLRGDPLRARAELDDDLGAPAKVHALLALGATDEARACAEAALLRGERLAWHPAIAYQLQAAAALARCASGDAALAAQGLDLAIVRAGRAGVRGMLLGIMHEARARVAIEMDDRSAFRRHLHELTSAYERGTPALRARCEQLGIAARRAMLSLPPPGSLEARLEAALGSSELRSLLDTAFSREERLSQALTLLAERAKASRGFLFGMQASGLRLSATLGGGPPPDGIEDMLSVYLSAELEASEAAHAQTRTISGSFAAVPDMVAWINDGQHAYYPVLLSAVIGERRRVAGVAALALPMQRDPKLPPDFVSEISRALLEAGDVVGANAAD